MNRFRFVVPVMAAVCGAAFGQEMFSSGVERGGPLAPGIERARIAALTFDLGDAQPGSVFSLNLFEDAQFEAVIEEIESGPAASVFSGSLIDAPHSVFMLSLAGGQAAGEVRAPGWGVFHIRPAGAAGQVIEQLDETGIEECGTQLLVTPPVGAADEANDGGIAAGELDVLVVYTPAARDYWGGTVQTETRLRQHALDTNNYYANSGLSTRLRLVHVQQVNYVESGSSSTDLNRLRNSSDGHMDEVHALRQQYGADLVALIARVTDVCGIAWLYSGNSGYGFSLTSASCSSLTFAHELGHNMGCCHDRDNSGSGCFTPTSYGYRFTGNGGTLWRTIMSYAPGTRIGHFSNPNVNYDGRPTGTATEYNAQTIGTTFPLVAAYRAAASFDDCDGNNIADSIDDATVGGVDGPTITQQPQPQSVPEGGSASFSVAANSGAGGLSYQWRRNGTNLSDGGAISGATTATLAINPVSAGHAGTYDVLVSDSCGTAQSQAASLAVGSDCEPCDANCDGSVNAFDIQPFVNQLSGTGGPCSECAGDTNADGSVNPFDIQGMVDCLGG